MPNQQSDDYVRIYDLDNIADYLGGLPDHQRISHVMTIICTLLHSKAVRREEIPSIVTRVVKNVFNLDLSVMMNNMFKDRLN